LIVVLQQIPLDIIDEPPSLKILSPPLIAEVPLIDLAALV
jgi:hypothetical protein